MSRSCQSCTPSPNFYLGKWLERRRKRPLCQGNLDDIGSYVVFSESYPCNVSAADFQVSRFMNGLTVTSQV